MSKVQGTVKWFDSRKGYGFVAPTSDNSPTAEEIFVHQTSIQSEGAYRTLVENSEIEFDVEKEAESGKFKAINVTAPGGGPIKPPRRTRSKKVPNEDGVGEDVETPAPEEPHSRGRNRKGRRKPDGPPKQRTPFFHESIADEAKIQIQAKGFELGDKSTVDVSFGDNRIKLGQVGYAGLAHASGMLAEGTYTCDNKGLVSFKWERALKFGGGTWKHSDTGDLLMKLSLTEDDVSPVTPGETPESLWGAGKTDPKEALEANGFQMRRAVLTRPVRGRRSAPPSSSAAE
jgi:CspA family cold shock protein